MVQTTARGTHESERGAERKRFILEGASRVFRRRGLHRTGMRDIAAELGMHAGNLYYYFANKEELLAFCQEDTLSSLLELAAEVAASDDAPDRKLSRLIVGHVQVLNERSPGSLAHLEIEALGEPWRRRIQPRRDRYERAFRDLIAEGIEQGIFGKVDPGVATLAILGALNWTVKWFRADGPRSASEIGAEFAELLVGGLSPRREGS